MAAAAAQQFNLRWNNHTMNMLQILADNYEKETLVDVTISCQGKIIKAHKIVLGACSPQFQDIFDQHEAAHPVIIMNGVKYEDIRAIVEFMYKGEVKITESDLESLLATAEGLQVKGLSNVRATRPASGQQLQNSHSSCSTASSPEKSLDNCTDTKGLGSTNSDLSNSKMGDGACAERSHTNSNHSSLTNSPHHVSSPNSVLPLNTSPRRTPSSLTSANSQLGGNSSDIEETPSYLRRKRAKLASVNKDVNQNRCRETKPKRKRSPAVETVSTSVDDENSDELPLTIKIDPPYIRDIDEDDSDGVGKDSTFETSDGHQDVKAAGGATVEPKEKIPRPPNAFMIFANEWRRKLAVQFSNESNKEISVRLGIMWKNLASQQKEEYFAASRQANDDHKKKYPDYYYSPKEARMRKRWKIQQQQVNQMMSAGQYNPVHLVKVYMDDSDGSVRKQSGSQQQLKEDK